MERSLSLSSAHISMELLLAFQFLEFLFLQFLRQACRLKSIAEFDSGFSGILYTKKGLEYLC